MIWITAALGGCVFDSSGLPAEEHGQDQGPLDKQISAVDGGAQAERGRADLQGALLEGGAADQGPCPGLTCPLGCDDLLNRCIRVDPSNVSADQFFDDVSGSLGLAGGAVISINTDDGEIKGDQGVLRVADLPGVDPLSGIFWGIQAQGGYPEISVFGVTSLMIPPGTDVNVIGTRAFALYATMDITVEGKLIAAGSQRFLGPGGFSGGESNGADGNECFNGEGEGGKHTGSGDSQIESGGGGGGRIDRGGKGGDSVFYHPDLKGGRGGDANGAVPLVPLYGGCGGGAGGGPDDYDYIGDGGYGGGGGGAIQLIANGHLSVSGVVTAPGAGGEGGNYGAGGGGGGSGGAIFLEAVRITISGMVAANGGGGGGGGPDTQTATAPDGQDGQPSQERALGGPASGFYGGGGGLGGSFQDDKGGNGKKFDGNTGGGGGAAGCIHLRAQSNGAITAGTQNCSPGPHLSDDLATW